MVDTQTTTGQKEEKEEKIFPVIIVSCIVGIFFGVLVSLVLGKNVVLYGVIGAVGGILLGLAIFFYSHASPSTKQLINVVFIVLIIAVIVIFVYKISTSGFTFPFFLDIFSFFKRGFADIKCAFSEECLFEKKQQTFQLPDFKLSVEYIDDYIQNGNIDFFVKMSLINQRIDNLVVEPYCYKKINNESLLVYSLQSYAVGKSFVFSKSQREMNTGFRCRGNTQNQKETIVVGFNFPYTANLLFTVFVKSTPQQINESKGIQQATEGPYVLTIDMPSDMPLKDGQYEFFIKLKKNYDVMMKEIDVIKIDSPHVNVYCAGFGNEIRVKREELKNYKVGNDYVFPCTMQIVGASNILEKRFITIEANYTVYKEFEKELREEGEK